MKLRTLAAALACTLSSCRMGPNFHRPDPPGVARYTRGGVRASISADGVAQVVRPGAQLAATWWSLFGSRPLDELVRLALANNQDLATARANLRRSEWNMRAGAGVFLPQVDLTASAARIRQNFAQFDVGGSQAAQAAQSALPGAAGAREFSLYTATGNISYTLDVWGGNRRRLEALRAQVDVQYFSLAAAHLSVTGNVVSTAIARAGYAEQIRVTEELIAELRDQIGLAQVQARAGTVAYSTVLALETQLANTALTLPPLRQQLAAADALLATLLGYAPAQWRPMEIALADLTLPRELPVSLPAELVRQRPDVLIAEATLHVSSANIGVATAAMLPTFSLSGAPGFQSTNLSNLLSFDNFVWSFGGNLLAPIFHGGSLNAQRWAAIEDFRGSLAHYRQTVLSALRDVATSLEAVVHDAEGVAAANRAVDVANETRKLVQINYENGLATYLDVIVANGQYREAVISQVGARVRRLQDTVALFIALGGGWWQHGAATPACAR